MIYVFVFQYDTDTFCPLRQQPSSDPNLLTMDTGWGVGSAEVACLDFTEGVSSNQDSSVYLGTSIDFALAK